MTFCLPKFAADKFIESLKSGKINPEKLSLMDSKDREGFFKDIVGKDNARDVNRLFESKLLLKNQQKGLIDWAKETAKLDGWDDARKNRIIDRIEKIDRIFNPSEEEVFLNQLASEALNIGVTEAESKAIYELSKKISDTKKVTSIEQIRNTISNLDKIDTSKLSKTQKDALLSVKDKLQELHDTRNAEKIKAQEIKDEASEKQRVAREESRAKEREKKEKIKEQAKVEKLSNQEEVKRVKDMMKDIAKELQAKEAQIRKEQVAAERAHANEIKKMDQERIKDALGRSMKQVKNIFGDEIPQDIQKQVDEIVASKSDIGKGGNRMDYGRARVQFDNYIKSLKEDASHRSLKEIANDAVSHPLDSLIELGGQAKSAKASLDNSAIFRQGWKTMFTNPEIWFKNSVKSFTDIAKTMSGKDALDETKADIVSRENYQLMKKGKLAIGTTEEAFPGSFLEKIPGLGRLYRASEQAYTGFVYRMRADIFDKQIEIAKQAGVDISDIQNVEGIAKVINSLTGRGHLGRAEKAASFMNNIFFSPRFAKSHIDAFLLHPLGAEVGRGTFAQKLAAKNMAKIVIGNVLILAIIHAMDPEAVELDPRSSDFGKIKIGDTRFDVSGGAASIGTLAARILTYSTKSSSTGSINPLNSGKFGSSTVFSTLVDFMAGKASPIASVFIDYAKGQDRAGNPVTLSGEAANLLAPLPITNAIELMNDPNSANTLASMIADGLGISVNSYGNSSSGLVAKDKPEVLNEVFNKMSEGDKEGATSLAHDFNANLKQTITSEIKQKNPTIDPNDLEQKIDTKYKREAIYIPTDDEVKDFQSNGKDVVEKILSSGQPVIAKR